MATAFSVDCTTKGNCEQWYVGTILSTAAYGVVLFLSFACAINFSRALLKAPARPGDTDLLPNPVARRMKKLLLAFLVAMFLLSTFSVITAGFRARLLFVRHESSRVAVLERFVVCAEACTLVVANWAAGLSMMWRCLVVYSGSSQSIQTNLTLFLALLSLVSLGSGIFYIIAAFRGLNVFMIAFSFITATINITITILIVARLSFHQRYIQKTLGKHHGSPYGRLQCIVTESAMLIVVFNVAHGVIAWKQKDKYVLVLPHQLLVHIYVISALLVLYLFKVVHALRYARRARGARDGQRIFPSSGRPKPF
ncbi:hypothetical protein NLJ89_g4094 [Agrocybe chaxingu]|uniref:Uncharacterized protein n=1 Tax=Agrocybe chaxingu TaxID=84603 RepID=A0A9W8K3Q7_9AGAR|nr:hypothetical protein NLJ89_g4094 [Agrocybe chaxingu]